MSPAVQRAWTAASDWAHALGRQASAWASRTPPERFVRPDAAADVRCGSVPVVVVPGIWEPWRYLLPLVTALHRRGHPVHPVASLGWNGADLATSADRVVDAIGRADLRGAVIVAHSKGGLIGKRVLLEIEPSRVVGLVAVCTPFAGSSLAVRALARTQLGLFSPASPLLAGLGAETAVNARIVAIRSAWDEMIPRPSDLPGATNVTLTVPGHFRPLVNAGVHDIIHTHIHALAAAGTNQ